MRLTHSLKRVSQGRRVLEESRGSLRSGGAPAAPGEDCSRARASHETHVDLARCRFFN